MPLIYPIGVIAHVAVFFVKYILPLTLTPKPALTPKPTLTLTPTPTLNLP